MADLRPLQSELDAVLNKVNQWSLSKENELNSQKASHIAFLDTQNEFTMQLKKRENNSKIKMERISQASNKSQQALAEMQSQVEDLSAQSSQLPSELAVLQDELEAEKENFFKEEEALETCQRSREIKKASLEMGHELYEKNLGLRFERKVEGSLVVNLHNIDPQDPKRQFYFTIRVEDETTLYNVSECVPRVDGLEELVRQLNDSNDLSLFVRRVRKAWVAAAAAAAAAGDGGRRSKRLI